MKVVLFLGYSGSGKTTTLTTLARGITRARWGRVGTLKHIHHRATIDTRGKDTWLHANAGASPVVAVARSEICIIQRTKNAGASPERLLDIFRRAGVDYVFVEGFFETFSKKRGMSRVLCTSSKREAEELIKIHGRRISFICGRIAERKNLPKEIEGIPVLKFPEQTRRALELIGRL